MFYLVVVAIILINFVNIWIPVEIPAVIMDALKTFFSSIWALEGFLPIEAIMRTIDWVLSAIIAFIMFKLIFSTAGGKTDIK